MLRTDICVLLIAVGFNSLPKNSTAWWEFDHCHLCSCQSSWSRWIEMELLPRILSFLQINWKTELCSPPAREWSSSSLLHLSLKRKWTSTQMHSLAWNRRWKIYFYRFKFYNPRFLSLQQFPHPETELLPNSSQRC